MWQRPQPLGRAFDEDIFAIDEDEELYTPQHVGGRCSRLEITKQVGEAYDTASGTR